MILDRLESPLVIFVDEIDITRRLLFETDEFFAAIRACYNARTQDAAYNHLTFCLLGVASPTDLIRDPLLTPFNIGARVGLQEADQACADELVIVGDEDADHPAAAAW